MTPVVTLSVLAVIATAALAKGLWLWDWRLMALSIACSGVIVGVGLMAKVAQLKKGRVS